MAYRLSPTYRRFFFCGRKSGRPSIAPKVDPPGALLPRAGIEVFFKQIKQTLKVCDFLGHSKSAIQWQIWTALLLYINESIYICRFRNLCFREKPNPAEPEPLFQVLASLDGKILGIVRDLGSCRGVSTAIRIHSFRASYQSGTKNRRRSQGLPPDKIGLWDDCEYGWEIRGCPWASFNGEAIIGSFAREFQ